VAGAGASCAQLQAVSLDEAEGISKQLTNLGVNAGVLVALVFFILRDFAERSAPAAVPTCSTCLRT
jgi:hypothetical protein